MAPAPAHTSPVLEPNFLRSKLGTMVRTAERLFISYRLTLPVTMPHRLQSRAGGMRSIWHKTGRKPVTPSQRSLRDGPVYFPGYFEKKLSRRMAVIRENRSLWTHAWVSGWRTSGSARVFLAPPFAIVCYFIHFEGTQITLPA